MLGADASNPWYWWLVGYGQFVQGDRMAALASANVSRQLDPDFPWSCYLIALVQLDLNQYASAEKELTVLIEGKKIQSTEAT